ncbi:MAG TPA: hypothetical protein VMM92_00580 [Thermoanaerobaculia bacterium]|nr:hypothetical protein [Thermoanaerobaculia bacterium]
MLSFFLIGAALGLLLISVEIAPRHRWLAAGLVFFVLVASTIVAVAKGQTQFLGNESEPWYNTSPWKELVLLFLTLLGMAARSLDEAIAERHRQIEQLQKDGKRRKPRLRIDPWEFSRPFLVSVATFGGLLSQIGTEHLTIVSLTLAFQTGFFWQTLLRKHE